jgi:formylglycine-generating enzyme
MKPKISLLIFFILKIIAVPVQAQLKDKSPEAAPAPKPRTEIAPKERSADLPKPPKPTAPKPTVSPKEVKPVFAEPEMIVVEGGQFTMGNNEATQFEKPAHTVTISTFSMAKFEVTQKQWMEVTGRQPSGHAGCPDCPVENVSWEEVQEFIKKINKISGKKYRLPTEAEWEYAAKGGKMSSHFTFSGSNAAADVAWSSENSGDSTHPVGKKKPNELGIFDMSGNVSEWCEDWFDMGFYSSSPAENPKNDKPGQTPVKVKRGGDFQSVALKNARNSCRNMSPFDVQQPNIGFRLCR